MRAPLVPGRSAVVWMVLFLGILAGLGTAAAYWTSAQSVGATFDAGVITGLALAFLAARLLTLQLPQGDQVSITLVVGLAGLCLRGTGEVLAAALIAGAIDAAVRISQEGIATSRDRITDVIRSESVLALLSPWQLLVGLVVASPTAGDKVLIVGIVAGASYALVDISTLAVQQWIAGGVEASNGVKLLFRPLGSVYMVHIAMAAVVLRVYPSLGPWGLAIALLLTLILQNSFNLNLRIRRAYAQTIGALAHAAELDRPQDTGHAERVADLAVAVGRAHGFASTDLERIGYAALLHDVGRIGHEGEGTDAQHGIRGAEIVDGVPFLEGVAPLIKYHREEDNPSTPEGAVIVGICCRYDHLRARIGAQAALRRLEAGERDRHSRVVKTLTYIVQRQSGLFGVTEDSL